MKKFRKENVDFIVMGARGHTALEEIFIGGVAEKVSRRAECPVFLIRRPRSPKG
jgi:nucleotide-binding universal stress UspA family protein